MRVSRENHLLYRTQSDSIPNVFRVQIERRFHWQNLKLVLNRIRKRKKKITKTLFVVQPKCSTFFNQTILSKCIYILNENGLVLRLLLFHTHTHHTRTVARTQKPMHNNGGLLKPFPLYILFAVWRTIFQKLNRENHSLHRDKLLNKPKRQRASAQFI